MKNIIFLAIGLIFIISCGKEPIEPTINPNLRENVNGILFQIGEIGTDCEFIFASRYNNETVYHIPRGLHDTLKVDYMRMKVTFELTNETIECEHDHPDFQIDEDSTTFQFLILSSSRLLDIILVVFDCLKTQKYEEFFLSFVQPKLNINNLPSGYYKVVMTQNGQKLLQDLIIIK